MMIHAYDPIYLNKSSRILGNMLHNAVYEFHMSGSDFMQQFIQSGIARQFENGNPKYIAGKSGLELFLDVVGKTTGQIPDTDIIETYERSDAYWVGWVLAHYQWYSGKSFQNILETISYEQILGLYSTLHEADIQKSYEVIDMHFQNAESKLKSIRKRCGMTQEELAELSGVSLNTIKAYERKSKDLNKAQIDIVLRLVKALKCNITDLVE